MHEHRGGLPDRRCARAHRCHLPRAGLQRRDRSHPAATTPPRHRRHAAELAPRFVRRRLYRRAPRGVEALSPLPRPARRFCRLQSVPIEGARRERACVYEKTTPPAPCASAARAIRRHVHLERRDWRRRGRRAERLPRSSRGGRALVRPRAARFIGSAVTGVGGGSIPCEALCQRHVRRAHEHAKQRRRAGAQRGHSCEPCGAAPAPSVIASPPAAAAARSARAVLRALGAGPLPRQAALRLAVAARRAHLAPPPQQELARPAAAPAAHSPRAAALPHRRAPAAAACGRPHHGDRRPRATGLSLRLAAPASSPRPWAGAGGRGGGGGWAGAGRCAPPPPPRVRIRTRCSALPRRSKKRMRSDGRKSDGRVPVGDAWRLMAERRIHHQFRGAGEIPTLRMNP